MKRTTPRRKQKHLTQRNTKIPPSGQANTPRKPDTETDALSPPYLLVVAPFCVWYELALCHSRSKDLLGLNNSRTTAAKGGFKGKWYLSFSVRQVLEGNCPLETPTTSHIDAWNLGDTGTTPGNSKSLCCCAPAASAFRQPPSVLRSPAVGSLVFRPRILSFPARSSYRHIQPVPT